MNTRTIWRISVVAIVLVGLVQAAESRSLLVAVDGNIHLLNTGAGSGELLSPMLDAETKPVSDNRGDGVEKTEPSRHTGYSAPFVKNSRATAASVRQKTAGIPPLWISILGTAAGLGLAIVGFVLWRRYCVSRRDWMPDNVEGRLLYHRWARSSVPAILASKLVQIRRISVRLPSTIVDPKDDRELRPAKAEHFVVLDATAVEPEENGHELRRVA